MRSKQSSYAILPPDIRTRLGPGADTAIGNAGNAPDTRAARAVAPVRRTRSSLRREVPFDLLVEYGMTHSIPWHIQDLGLGGAFVAMDTIDLKAGEPLEFLLRFKLAGRAVGHRIPTTITRVEPAGVALQFGDYSDEAYLDLTHLLYSL